MMLHQMLPSVNITWWESPEAVGAVCAGQVRFAFSHKWASICFEFEEHHWAHFGLWEMLVRGEDGCSNWNIPALTQSLQRLVKSKPYSWATCGLSTDEIVLLCYRWGGGGGDCHDGMRRCWLYFNLQFAHFHPYCHCCSVSLYILNLSLLSVSVHLFVLLSEYVEHTSAFLSTLSAVFNFLGVRFTVCSVCFDIYICFLTQYYTCVLAHTVLSV